MGRLRPTIYDPHRIERQVKSRTLTKGWLAATLLGSALVGSFAFLMPWSSGIAVYLLIAGVTIIFVYAYWSAVTVGDNESLLIWPTNSCRNADASSGRSKPITVARASYKRSIARYALVDALGRRQ